MVKGFSSYEVSDQGQVRNIRTGKILKPIIVPRRNSSLAASRVCLFPTRRYIGIHRLVYAAFVGKIPKNMVIDHIDRNPLNNTLGNLRCVTRAANLRNTYGKNVRKTSKYIGVSVKKAKKSIRYHAQIMHNYKQIHIGYFDTELEAAIAYDKKVIDLGYDYTMTNFPEKGVN